VISKKAKSIFRMLKVMNFKEKVDYEHPKRSGKLRIPRKIFNNYNVKIKKIDGRLVVTISPLTGQRQQHILFFHGGSYAVEANSGHFGMMTKLIDMTGCIISFIQYPLAPEYTYQDTFKMVSKAYAFLLSKYENSQFVFMGDSAGGGLALAFAIKIKEEAKKMPKQIILYSPWLDLGLSNPDISLYEEKDLILNVKALYQAGVRYGDHEGATNPLLSPIYGDLNHLGEIAIFYGTDEIFYPDCKNFSELKGLEGTNITSFEYEGMQHDWVVFPIPESDSALKTTSQLLL
jgi:acetyl esterase/lipase